MLKKICLWRQLLAQIKEEGIEKVLMEIENRGIDPLTGIKNRREFNTIARKEFERARRKQEIFSLLFVDVDDLSQINNTEGHKKGDERIQEVAEKLQNCCREMDICFRYAGDEFIVLLPETDQEEAKKVKERITNNIPAISVGISTSREKQDLSEMVDKADARMYKDKNNKK